ncbi:MAG: hypothetical protein GY830_01190 [Bacteroidetes bacterium]|nr:hypothetical protein [Bacteroidota bacterium]
MKSIEFIKIGSLYIRLSFLFIIFTGCYLNKVKYGKQTKFKIAFNNLNNKLLKKQINNDFLINEYLNGETCWEGQAIIDNLKNLTDKIKDYKSQNELINLINILENDDESERDEEKNNDQNHNSSFENQLKEAKFTQNDINIIIAFMKNNEYTEVEALKDDLEDDPDETMFYNYLITEKNYGNKAALKFVGKLQKFFKLNPQSIIDDKTNNFTSKPILNKSQNDIKLNIDKKINDIDEITSFINELSSENNLFKKQELEILKGFMNDNDFDDADSLKDDLYNGAKNSLFYSYLMEAKSFQDTKAENFAAKLRNYLYKDNNDITKDIIDRITPIRNNQLYKKYPELVSKDFQKIKQILFSTNVSEILIAITNSKLFGIVNLV